MSGRETNWRHEKESAWLYVRLADIEPDPLKKKLFLSLGAAAEKQAATWQPAELPPHDPFQPSLRARLAMRLAQHLGLRSARPILVALKLRGFSVYGAPLTSGHMMPSSVSEVGQRHRASTGGNLRAAVFGVNDGLVSNAALVLGIAATGTEPSTVWLTGVAGMLAGGLSMAAGEYVSVRSQREMFERQIALERAELAEYPEQEAEELALIYNARGLELARARGLARDLLKNPEHALDVLAREELGLNPDELGSPLLAAGTSFAAFVIGALLPLLPFTLGLAAAHIVPAVIAVSASGLALVGLAISLFTGHGALRGALRMVLIGGGAGLIAWLVGSVLGVALA